MTRRRIIVAAIIGAVLAIGLIANAIRADNDLDQSGRVADCTIAAPAGWPCQEQPTGYPGER